MNNVGNYSAFYIKRKDPRFEVSGCLKGDSRNTYL